MDELETIWSALLSGDPEQIKLTWKQLSAEEAKSVLAHLQKMAREAGFSEVQKEAARQALAVIEANG